MLVDSHCHLNYPEFADLEGVLARAREAGVVAMQTISTKRSDFNAVIGIAESHTEVYASIGIHPHEAKTHQDATVEELLSLASHPKVIGIGETGLDFYYEHSPRAEQEALFRTHIEVSRQSGLPLIVHSRDADEQTVAILHEEYKKEPFTGLIHCFSTSKYLADKAIEIGFYISLSGILTFPKAQELRDTVKTLPLEKLLVETDAPYLAPTPYRGKPNEPSYTKFTALCLADLMGVSYDEICRITTGNFYSLFRRAQLPRGEGCA